MSQLPPHPPHTQVNNVNYHLGIVLQSFLDIITDTRLRMSSTIATLATSSCSPARGGVVRLAMKTLRMMIVMDSAQRRPLASSVTRS